MRFLVKLNPSAYANLRRLPNPVVDRFQRKNAKIFAYSLVDEHATSW